MTVGDSVGNKPGHGAAGGLKAAALHVLSVHGLLVFGIALVIVFALLLPATFTGSQNFRAILGNNTTVALLAMAEMIVIATGNYDLSIAYNVGLMHIVAMGLLTDAMVPWPLVVILTIAAGGLVGWINGVLVEYAKIDSFIATLGVGTILYGFGTWYTNGTQLVGNVPQAFADLNDARLLTIPLPTYMVAAIAILAWIGLEHVPIGRQLYAIGSNRKAAELTGIRARRLVMGAFVCSGLIVGLAGVLLAARLQVAQSSVGPEFLLPAFVGALLGATTVRPGRVNAWGTIIAVLVLAIGIAGLQQLGNSFFAEPIFQGTALIVSVGLAGYAARRRKR
ncbi:MAG: ABC transporter permease [Rhizobiales bacterium]|mgnify:FL=1|nr:ABC transporter permease [Hyphomicrobiales bacterium]MBN9010182.1 ABC transporter permease [Hyphomicrobiales bacterium]